MNIIDKWNPFKNKYNSPVSQELIIVNTSKTSDNFFQTLPNEVITHIFYKLFKSCENISDFIETIERISNVCRHFRTIVYDQKVLRDIFIQYSDESPCVKKIDDFWIFRKRYKIASRFWRTCLQYTRDPIRVYDHADCNISPNFFFRKQLYKLEEVDPLIVANSIADKILNLKDRCYSTALCISLNWYLSDGEKQKYSCFWNTYAKWWHTYLNELTRSYFWRSFYSEEIRSFCETSPLSFAEDISESGVTLEP